MKIAEAAVGHKDQMIHFISGLPCSGSSLPAALLNHQPERWWRGGLGL
jgi:hypothetical protein